MTVTKKAAFGRQNERKEVHRRYPEPGNGRNAGKKSGIRKKPHADPDPQIRVRSAEAIGNQLISGKLKLPYHLL